MSKLLYGPYAVKCILGSEIIYLSCLFYGSFLTGEAEVMHRKFFELLPGFTWLTPWSVIMGGVVVAFYAFVVGLFCVWMHNSSLEK